jgi:hypothetical protein
MTKQEFQDLIITVINDNNGGKGTEIATLVGVSLTDKNLAAELEYDIWEDGFTPLIEQGKIIEIEYVLPNMPHRIKSFFLPADTEILPAR